MVHHHTLAASGPASVILTIGAGLGALVLRVSPEWNGREIEISTTNGARTHAAVRERVLPSGSVFCVLYDGLAADTYTIWRDSSTPGGTATVRPGEVAEVDWSASA